MKERGLGMGILPIYNVDGESVSVPVDEVTRLYSGRYSGSLCYYVGRGVAKVLRRRLGEEPYYDEDYEKLVLDVV